MTGMKSVEQPLITVAEALELSEHIKLPETYIATELFSAFEKSTARRCSRAGTLPVPWHLFMTRAGCRAYGKSG